MPTSKGVFVWYDLMTTDMQAAQTFYKKVIGWDAKDSGMPDRSYTIWSMGSTMIGGLMPIPEGARSMGARPAWMGYIGVDDVDAYAARIQSAGGAIHRPAEDIPGIGRFCVVADPQGASFILFRGSTNEAPTPAPEGTPGHIGWHELHAGDGASAFTFYSNLFGWTKSRAMDMGPMGVYQLFATGGPDVGGMMTKMPEIPMPFWLFYFNVDSADAALKRINDGGGKVINGPMEVPGPMWIVQALDPQGAMFAVVASKP